MDLVVHPEKILKDLSFFLAQEEYLAHAFPGRDLFFAWQVDPTVIIGRNQLLEKEVNVDFCRCNNIDIVRRKSGGGAVLADRNNIMFSYITTSDNVPVTFSKYTSMISSALRSLGLDAHDNSRNDILIGDRKVSGNSFYHLNGRSIVHGTMLYDFDAEMMSKALMPSADKLESHGVTSVRSRVTTIKEHLPDLSIGDFLNHIINNLAADGETILLTESDRKEIELIRGQYLSPSWLEGKNPRCSLNFSQRIRGVGEISVHLDMDKGRIKAFTLSGDYMECGDASETIAAQLQGIRYEKESIEKALSNISVETVLPGVTNETMCNLLI